MFKDPQNIEITYELLVEDHAPRPDYPFDAYKPPKIEEFNVGMATMSLAEMIGPEDVGPIPELGSIDLDNSQELPRGCSVTHHGFPQPDILAMFHAKNTLTYLRGNVWRQKKVYTEEARRYIQDTALQQVWENIPYVLGATTHAFGISVGFTKVLEDLFVQWISKANKRIADKYQEEFNTPQNIEYIQNLQQTKLLHDTMTSTNNQSNIDPLSIPTNNIPPPPPSIPGTSN